MIYAEVFDYSTRNGLVDTHHYIMVLTFGNIKVIKSMNV